MRDLRPTNGVKDDHGWTSDGGATHAGPDSNASSRDDYDLEPSHE